MIWEHLPSSGGIMEFGLIYTETWRPEVTAHTGTRQHSLFQHSATPNIDKQISKTDTYKTSKEFDYYIQDKNEATIKSTKAHHRSTPTKTA